MVTRERNVPGIRGLRAITVTIVLILSMVVLPIENGVSAGQTTENYIVDSYIVSGSVVDRFGLVVDLAIVVAVNLDTGNSTWVYANGSYALDLATVNGTLGLGQTIKLVASNGICISNYTFVLDEANPGRRIDFVLDPEEPEVPNISNPNNAPQSSNINPTSELKPELIIGSLSFSDERPVSSDTIVITATITNGGIFTESAMVVFFKDEIGKINEFEGLNTFAVLKEDPNRIGIDRVWFTHAEPAQTAEVTFNTGAIEGCHTIYAIVDPLNDVIEVDENNNKVSKNIIILTSALTTEQTLESADELLGKLTNPAKAHIEQAIRQIDDALTRYEAGKVGIAVITLDQAIDNVWKAMRQTSDESLIYELRNLTFAIIELEYVMVHKHPAKDIAEAEKIIMETRAEALVELTAKQYKRWKEVDGDLANALNHFALALKALIEPVTENENKGWNGDGESLSFDQRIQHAYDRLQDAREETQELIYENKITVEFGEWAIEKITQAMLIFPPDLCVSLWDILIEGSLIKGETNWVTVTIHNDGVVRADKVAVNIYDNNNLFESLIISRVSPQESVSETIEWVPATTKTHIIKVVIDPSSKIIERNKENNMAEDEVFVVGGTEWWYGTHYVNDTEKWNDTEIILRWGNLIINSTGHLVFKNVSLTIVTTREEWENDIRWKILIKDGGSFDILGKGKVGSIVTAQKRKYPYKFITRGTLNITRNSIVEYVWGDERDYLGPGGIQLYSTSNCRIEDSTVCKGHTHNIYIDGCSPRILNSNITDAGTNTGIGHGLYIVSNASPIIEGNWFNNSAEDGVYVNLSSPRIAGNTITNCTRYGIYSENANLTLSGNEIIGNGKFGVYCVGNGTATPQISNNTIIDHKAGIYLIPKYPEKYITGGPNKYALLCGSANNFGEDYKDKDAMAAQTLQAYYVLKDLGYDDEHITLMLWHDDEPGNTGCEKPINYPDDDDGTDEWVSIYNDTINNLWGWNGSENYTVDDPVIKFNHTTPITKDLLREQIASLSRRVNKSDEVLIYLVNHGYKAPDGTTYFCFEGSGNTSNLSGWVSEYEMVEWLGWIQDNCSEMIILVDMCFSGPFIKRLVQPNRTLVSCAGDTYGYMYVNATVAPFAGSLFFYPFWEYIKNGSSIKEAYTKASACIYQLGIFVWTVKDIQDPWLLQFPYPEKWRGKSIVLSNTIRNSEKYGIHSEFYNLTIEDNNIIFIESQRASIGIHVYRSTVNITHNTITAEGLSSLIAAIVIENTISTINRNNISNIYPHPFYLLFAPAYGIYIFYNSLAIVSKNNISQLEGCGGVMGPSIGIFVKRSSSIIRENNISDIRGAYGYETEQSDVPCQYGGPACGLYISASSSVTIINNTISNCTGGKGGACTISGPFFRPKPGGVGAGITLVRSVATVKNNCITDCVGGVGGRQALASGASGGDGIGIGEIYSSSPINDNDIMRIEGGIGGDGLGQTTDFWGNKVGFPGGAGGDGIAILTKSISSSVFNNTITLIDGGIGGLGSLDAPCGEIGNGIGIKILAPISQLQENRSVIYNDVSFTEHAIYCDNGSAPMITINDLLYNENGILYNGNPNPTLNYNVIKYNTNGIRLDYSTITLDEITNANTIESNDNAIYCYGGQPTITNNTITANTVAIKADNSNCTILNNIITSNSYGIYYANSEGGLFAGNSIIGHAHTKVAAVVGRFTFYNSYGWGIYCQDASPVIKDNKDDNYIARNLHGIICNNSSPLIKSNDIRDHNGRYPWFSAPDPLTGRIKMTYIWLGWGLTCYNSEYVDVRDNDFISNRRDMTIYSSTGTINNNNISGAVPPIGLEFGFPPRGITCYDTCVTVVNSTISDSNVDFYLYESYVECLNTTFTKSKVFFEDYKSTLNIYWYLHVFVQSAYIEVVNNSIVLVYNKTAGATVVAYDKAGAEIFNGFTDKDGWAKWIPTQEYRQNKTNRINYTPHNVTARKGTSTNSTVILMNKTRTLSLILARYKFEIPFTPLDIDTVDGSTFWVTDIGTEGKFYHVDSEGKIIGTFYTGLINNWGIATVNGSMFWIASPVDGEFVLVNQTGNLITSYALNFDASVLRWLTTVDGTVFWASSYYTIDNVAYKKIYKIEVADGWANVTESFDVSGIAGGVGGITTVDGSEFWYISGQKFYRLSTDFKTIASVDISSFSSDPCGITTTDGKEFWITDLDGVVYHISILY